MRTIAIVNQKGGCGKTTTAINLAGVFAARGMRTLLVDMDPQGHCAAGLAIPEQRIDKTIGDAMLASSSSPVDADRLLWRVSRNLDLAPSNTRLSALEAARGELATKSDPELRLKRAIDRFETQYDICLIDCSPAIGLLAFNALAAANEVLIPVETGFFALQGASKQVNAIKSLAKRLGVSPLYRVLPTMHDPESMLSKDLLDEIRRRFAGRVVPTVIRYDVRLREAASFGQPVIEYAPHSAGAADYTELAQWLLEHAPSTALSQSERDEQSLADSIADVDDRAAPTGTADHTTSSAGTGGRAADIAARTKRMHAPAGESISASVGSAGASNEMSSSTPNHAFGTPPLNPFAGRPAPAQNFSAQGSSDRSVSTADNASTRAFEVKPPRHAESPLSQDRDASFRSQPPRFGVMPGVELATFTLPATIGRQVSVAGEFNGWSATPTPMTLNETGEAWQVCVPLPAGANQYRLVVDGAWIADPYNPNVAPNPFGGTNSVVMVAPKAASGTSSIAATNSAPIARTDATSGADTKPARSRSKVSETAAQAELAQANSTDRSHE